MEIAKKVAYCSPVRQRSIWSVVKVRTNRTFAVILVLISVFLCGCKDRGYIAGETSDAIYEQLKANDFEMVNLAEFAGSSWTKVCFLGPYNQMSEEVLGFDWQVSEHTEVLRSDGHNVIVFATESQVVEYVVHSRSRGDFGQLSGKCFKRSDSTLIRDPHAEFGQNYVSADAE